MNHDINDEAEVSQTYQLLNQTVKGSEPPSVIDQKIRTAAAQSIDHRLPKPAKRFIVPLSIAASVLLASVVGLNLFQQDAAVLQQAGINADVKKPMFMLQRSKPGSVDNMLVQLNRYLDQGEIDKARQLYKKINYHFPGYQAEPELTERLRAENIL